MSPDFRARFLASTHAPHESTGPDAVGASVDDVDGELGDTVGVGANLGSGSSPEHAPSASTDVHVSAVRTVRVRVTEAIIPREAPNRNERVARLWKTTKARHPRG